MPSERHSVNAIRAFLETVALEKQCVLCALNIDGQAVNLAVPLPAVVNFSRIEAESVALDDSELLVLKTARQQAAHARECVETALTLVLINDMTVARELWWQVAAKLKEPILTLSLLPDNQCGQASGRATLKKLRQWQLEQISSIIREVDIACTARDTIPLSNALETRVLSWLEKLENLINLWLETTLASSRLGIKSSGY
jgi:hypothetical protein